MTNELKQLTQNPQILTMSSREIAELLEKRHDKVKRSIDRLVIKEVIKKPPMGEIKTATKPVIEYHLEKRDTYVVVAQLSPEFTARLVDRWQELEEAEKAGPAILSLSVQKELSVFWLKHTANRKFVRYARMDLTNKEIALLCGWRSPATVTAKRRTAEALGIIQPPRDLASLQARARHITCKRGLAQ